MPRPNQARTIATEQALARRLAYERERRGMSYDGLASRMTKAGCPIQPSGLYKIEKAGRRITVDEMMALAEVFDLEVQELLQPVELILHADITRVEEAEAQAWTQLFDAIQKVLSARDERAELYRKALEGGDPELGVAVDAFWEQRNKANQAAATGGNLAKIGKEFEVKRAAWTPEQAAENDRQGRIEEAMGVLVDAIADNTDQILGDS